MSSKTEGFWEEYAFLKANAVLVAKAVLGSKGGLDMVLYCA